MSNSTTTTYTAPNILDLTVGAVLFIVKKIFFKRSPMVLPMEIQKYQLIRQLTKADNAEHLAVGIYSLDERKFLIKRWEGRFKDLNCLFLLHEFYATKILASHINNANPSGVKVPTVVELIIENGRSVSAVFEFIEGKSAAQLLPEEQLVVLEKASDSLTSISAQLLDEEKFVIGFQHPGSMLIIGVFFALLSALMNPVSFGLIFRSWRSAACGMLSIMGEELVLAHRDLTPENILLTERGVIYILDCEMVSMTVPGYDRAYLSVDPLHNALFDMMIPEKKAGTKDFLRQHIAIHHILGSGSFLKTNREYLRQLSEIESHKV